MLSRRNALIHGRKNGISFYGSSLHSTQQFHGNEDSTNTTDNTKDQSPQLKQQTEDRQEQDAIHEKNCVEEDDDGLFFIEASRQAARTRQLQLRNASSSSSSIVSITNTNNQVEDDHENEDDNGNVNITIAPVGIKEEEEEEEGGVQMHQLVSNEKDDKVTQAHTNDEEMKTMEDSEPHIVTNDDNRLELPPSSLTNNNNNNNNNNATSLGITDVSSNDNSIMGETLLSMPEFENPLALDDDDNSSEKVQLSSDGKVIFEPKTNLEGNINEENVDMGLMVLTRALLAVKSVLDRKG